MNKNYIKYTITFLMKDGNEFKNCVLFKENKQGEKSVQDLKEIIDILRGKYAVVHAQNEMYNVNFCLINYKYFNVCKENIFIFNETDIKNEINYTKLLKKYNL